MAVSTDQRITSRDDDRLEVATVVFSNMDEDELWQRWREGDSVRLIARALGCPPSRVNAHLGRTGGIRPPTRRRAGDHLTVVEREEVSRGIASGLSARAIA